MAFREVRVFEVREVLRVWLGGPGELHPRQSDLRAHSTKETPRHRRPSAPNTSFIPNE